MTVQLELPDDLMEYLVPAGQDPSRAVLEDAVAEAYRQGRLTMHVVGRLLGLATAQQVDVFLGKHKIYDDYGMVDLEKDLASSEAAEAQYCREQTAA